MGLKRLMKIRVNILDGKRNPPVSLYPPLAKGELKRYLLVIKKVEWTQ